MLSCPVELSLHCFIASWTSVVEGVIVIACSRCVFPSIVFVYCFFGYCFCQIALCITVFVECVGYLCG